MGESEKIRNPNICVELTINITDDDNLYKTEWEWIPIGVEIFDWMKNKNTTLKYSRFNNSETI